MQEELRALSGTLRQFLFAHLPEAYPDWWSSGVIGALSIQQRQTAQQSNWTSLDDLDLAALLRVADLNWNEFRRRNQVSYEARNWLKEASSVRNRWAHEAMSRQVAPRQVYRDLDTVALLCGALGASAEVVAGIERSRDQVVVGAEVRTGANESAPQHLDSVSAAFAPATLVRLIARPEVKGVVTEVITSGPEQRFKVFHDSGIQTYYATQLEVVISEESATRVSAATLKVGLTSAQLIHPSTRFLYSLNAGRIEFEPYQYRPVLKLIQSDRPRLLIADDVGVGKTIEAGLILKELQARQSVTSVLVICPKPLVSENKWRDELKRFDEDFVHLDGGTLRHCLEETRLEGRWPARYRKAIVPYSLLDEKLLMGSGEGRRAIPGLIDLDPQPQFDLVIVDEAHNIRNTDTWRYRNVRQIIGGSEAVVFLSATPIQTGNNDLFTLLSLLRPDVVPSMREFNQLAEPNAALGRAEAAARSGVDGWRADALEALDEALETSWGKGVLLADPRTQLARDLLLGEADDDDTRVRTVRTLNSLNTFSNLINRTRRRDIGEFTTRKPETVEVDFTSEQFAVYSDLVGLCRRLAARKTPGLPVEFLLSTLQRQAASCLNGLSPLLRDMLESRMSIEEISEADGDEAELDPSLLTEFQSEVDALVAAAEALGLDDPKFDGFEKVVRDKQNLLNNKLLVFSTFRHTLAYLERRLAITKVRLAVVHGGVPEDERRDMRARFKLPKEDPQALDVLLSSEVGTEGLDYQFCDALVNYDLPWNPMRIEQRIGRIDRRGQRSETVAIINMVTRGTVDAAIYTRCLYRIGVFQQALGGSEEILGELTREIRSIAENLALTEQERDERLRQLADNKLGRIHEQTQLEDQQAQLFGLAIRHADDAGVEEATSPWLDPLKVANLVSAYLAGLDPDRQVAVGSKPVVTLRPKAEVREQLLRDAQASAMTGQQNSSWERWLKSTELTRLLTVNPTEAEDRPNVELLGPSHPLVRAAAKWASMEPEARFSLKVQTTSVAPGRYPVAIYGWNRLGVRDDYSIQAITPNPMLRPHLADLLTKATDNDSWVDPTFTESEECEEAHYAMWCDERADYQGQSRASIGAQLASLRTTNKARIAQLEEQLTASDHDRIQKMRHSQIEAAEKDFSRRVRALEEAGERSDVLSEPIAFGIIEVLEP